VGAGGIGDAQAGAEIVRIGHAVEHQKQRRAVDAVEQFREILRERHVARARHHALVTLGVREPPQTRFVGGDQAHARFLRRVQKLRHAAVLARGVVINIFDGRRVVPDARGDCMKTV